MSRRRWTRWILAVASVMVMSITGAGISVAAAGYQMYDRALASESLEKKVEEIRTADGFTKLEDLPETYKDAVISVEDHRFYSHMGIDPIAICRAIVNDIKAGRYAEGGSTITQQLAKNLYFTQEKELSRKAAEVYLAFELEEQYTKDEILELYVNCIYFGDGYNNIGEASEGYFGKKASEMTEYESTLLAGVPNAPSRYAPSKNPELARKRQQQVLRRMEACGCKLTIGLPV